VEAEGKPPLSYQWKFNGVNLPGATSESLTLSKVALNQSGNYTVTISNAAGAVTSEPASLIVLAAGRAVLSLNLYAGITLLGVPGGRYAIQYAEVLGQTTNWITSGTVTLPRPSAPFLYFDVTSTNQPQRFYRAVLVQ
jgi:hypothetical protein